MSTHYAMCRRCKELVRSVSDGPKAWHMIVGGSNAFLCSSGTGGHEPTVIPDLGDATAVKTWLRQA